jgi:hypothetical protein
LPEQKTLTLPPNLYLGLLPFRLKIRYDAPDRTYFVDEIRFDASKDLNHLFEELKQELGFELPRPTQCSFTSRPW